MGAVTIGDGEQVSSEDVKMSDLGEQAAAPDAIGRKIDADRSRGSVMDGA
ncbi:hypothetical protein J8J14_21490 [Roseomonas sp. SSH11]|uniref:Uncharacterized protein n=1 Tax=Pararoseomonas baculiformis TaxID=2820812 RepID=A0ABS4AJX8_9PROT|nr:hypothetical protein [Pararoseomonas baculiformis]MBP0447345.1 hypothetical protein [Pararoseomonas baculiformis]